jgi:hypothetical protein
MFVKKGKCGFVVEIQLVLFFLGTTLCFSTENVLFYLSVQAVHLLLYSMMSNERNSKTAY